MPRVPRTPQKMIETGDGSVTAANGVVLNLAVIAQPPSRTR